MTTGFPFRWRVATIAGALAAAMSVGAAFAATSTPAASIPGPPSSVMGSIADAAGPVAAGLPVEGYINGKLCSKQGKTEFTGNGAAKVTVYFIDVVSDSQTPGCGKDGDTVTIKIGDRNAPQTVKWEAGYNPLNITFGDVKPAVIPTFTPTPKGTPKAGATAKAKGTPTPLGTIPAGSPGAGSPIPTLKGGVAGTDSAPVAASTTDSSGFPLWGIVVIVVAALVVIGGGVGFVMARNHADGSDIDGGDGDGGSSGPPSDV